MILLESLESKVGLETLLEPKKRVYDLVTQVDGSMLNFHKVVKDSKEIEKLAEDLFNAKNILNDIRNKSRYFSTNNITEKLKSIKGMKSTDVDFI